MSTPLLNSLLSKREALETNADGIEKLLLVVGALVMLGVAGESIFGVRAFLNNRKIQAVQRSIDAERADIARKESDASADKIADAQRDAEEARSMAKGFESQIADFDARAKSAVAEAAKANLELARLTAPRILTDEQSERIARTLHPFAGQEFDIVPYFDIKESLNIANRILATLTCSPAGWKYIPGDPTARLMGGLAGVQVWRHPDADDSTKNAADWLVSSLSKEGIEAVLRIQNPVNNPKNNKLNLSVGTKP
jgi:hypothetical protein